MTEFSNAVGGVRLGERGLHLGHYVGTFAAAAAHREERAVYYVIKDTEPLHWEDAKRKQRWIEVLAREAAAIAPDVIKVRCVLTSVLMRAAWAVAGAIYDHVNYSALVTAHFAKAVIRSGQYTGSIRNFLFPLDEAIILTFLRTDCFYSNRDNERIVLFTRDVQHVLQRRCPALRELPLTKLRHFPDLSYLPGADHRRMHTAGKNTLSVISDDGEIERFCRSAFSLSRFFEEFPDELERFKRDGSSNYIPGDRFAPFALVRVLEGPARLSEFKELYSARRNERDRLSQRLGEIVTPRLKAWRERANCAAGRVWTYDEVKGESEKLARKASEAWGSRGG
ncbi:MAG TPA: hypothetical protein PKE55_00240 [Kiritimatiellia bacterium]|nr:hypothetical protein [Kiritimatiellia bacterium]